MYLQIIPTSTLVTAFVQLFDDLVPFHQYNNRRNHTRYRRDDAPMPKYTDVIVDCVDVDDNVIIGDRRDERCLDYDTDWVSLPERHCAMRLKDGCLLVRIPNIRAVYVVISIEVTMRFIATLYAVLRNHHADVLADMQRGVPVMVGEPEPEQSPVAEIESDKPRVPMSKPVIEVAVRRVVDVKEPPAPATEAAFCPDYGGSTLANSSCHAGLRAVTFEHCARFPYFKQLLESGDVRLIGTDVRDIREGDVGGNIHFNLYLYPSKTLNSFVLVSYGHARHIPVSFPELKVYVLNMRNLISKADTNPPALSWWVDMEKWICEKLDTTFNTTIDVVDSKPESTDVIGIDFDGDALDDVHNNSGFVCKRIQRCPVLNPVVMSRLLLEDKVRHVGDNLLAGTKVTGNRYSLYVYPSKDKPAFILENAGRYRIVDITAVTMQSFVDNVTKSVLDDGVLAPCRNWWNGVKEWIGVHMEILQTAPFTQPAANVPEEPVPATSLDVDEPIVENPIKWIYDFRKTHMQDIHGNKVHLLPGVQRWSSLSVEEYGQMVENNAVRHVGINVSGGACKGSKLYDLSIFISKDTKGFVLSTEGSVRYVPTTRHRYIAVNDDVFKSFIARMDKLVVEGRDQVAKANWSNTLEWIYAAIRNATK